MAHTVFISLDTFGINQIRVMTVTQSVVWAIFINDVIYFYFQ
jgi:hypothetical protein